MDVELIDYLDYHQKGVLNNDEKSSTPGELLREDVIAELGLSVTETAKRLGVSRVAFSRALTGSQ
ncbi:hypothetical protein Bcsk_002390 [Bartonella sp. CDC_skunk]|nr:MULTISPECIES: hypothetical protein [unclassified Bartonella]AQX20899.1 hypothetical protein Bcsk_002390 [Bartonella sp. CDC_skunk]AQX26155.1 hypothetical protein Bra60_001330 [Bartonella sp. Raccoon60]